MKFRKIKIKLILKHLELKNISFNHGDKYFKTLDENKKGTFFI